MKSKHQTIYALLSMGALVLSACATQPKTPLSADADPKSEIEKTENSIQSLVQRQYHLLAPKRFEEAQEHKNSAKEKMAKGAENTKVLNDIAISREAAAEAERIGEANAPKIAGVLTARQYAIDANAPHLDGKKFHSADDDLVDLGKDMEKNKFSLDARETSDLELRYGKSEIAARKVSELRGAKNIINDAEKAGADDKVPLLLEQANAQLASAEHAIELSPHNPSEYAAAVNRAIAEAKKLTEVLALASQNNSSETVALALWEKDRELANSRAALNEADSQANAEKQKLETRISERDEKLANQTTALATLETANTRYTNEEELKQRIEKIKATFSADEAEVMKDGKNLVVRLKKMQFSSGRSDLNPNSFETLKKVETLISAVPTSQITVEGHTDSTGPTSLNTKLSEQRAEAVKKYLISQKLSDQLPVDAVGFGSNKPLSTNKTKTGRAANRRVDIVIETAVVL